MICPITDSVSQDQQQALKQDLTVALYAICRICAPRVGGMRGAIVYGLRNVDKIDQTSI